MVTANEDNTKEMTDGPLARNYKSQRITYQKARNED